MINHMNIKSISIIELDHQHSALNTMVHTKDMDYSLGLGLSGF